MQANKRLHRQGQTERVIIHHLICTGTRDEDVMKALGRKENVQEWVMQSLKARIKAIREDKENGTDNAKLYGRQDTGSWGKYQELQRKEADPKSTLPGMRRIYFP